VNQFIVNLGYQKHYITILEDEVLSIKKRIDVEKEELILLD